MVESDICDTIYASISQKHGPTKRGVSRLADSLIDISDLTLQRRLNRVTVVRSNS